MKLKITRLNAVLACPCCRASISLPTAGKPVVCQACSEVYAPLPYSWDMIPSKHWQTSSKLWQTWQKLQEHGNIAYKMDPEHNLSVGERDDCKEFATFCNFKGLVLDVGCGPQPWPTYFGNLSTKAAFIGIDPLVGNAIADYVQFKALGEFLPFRANVFDHVVFATFLDHVVEPLKPLLEAKRVCKTNGQINIWIGVKKHGAPRMGSSANWYNQLKKPTLAEDLFHIQRLGIDELFSLLQQSEVKLIDCKEMVVDDYRSNYFIRAIK